MNGVHDVGGMDGFGSIKYELDEPVFHSEWEKAAFVFSLVPVKNKFATRDQFRHAVERMTPARYLAIRYYEGWMYALETLALEAGVIDANELEERTRQYLNDPELPLPESPVDEQLKAEYDNMNWFGPSAKKEVDGPPLYSVGDSVQIADDHPFGHTRRARYIRGKKAVVERVYDAYTYADAVGNGLEDDPQYTYVVRFDAVELWGPDTADPNGTVCFDVAESYISKKI